MAQVIDEKSRSSAEICNTRIHRTGEPLKKTNHEDERPLNSHFSPAVRTEKRPGQIAREVQQRAGSVGQETRHEEVPVLLQSRDEECSR